MSKMLEILKKRPVCLRIILTLLAIFFGSILTFKLVTLNLESMAAPTQEDYDYLKDYALFYAKTLDKEVIQDEDIEITWHYSGNGDITITLNKFNYKVEATYPIEVFSNDDGEFEIKIFYEEGIYLESLDSSRTWHNIFPIATGSMIFTIAVYVLIYILTNRIKKVIIDKKNSK